ncbi:MAG: VPLPA-CTERM sorting domain-containing protein [Pseudomonadota bacterium]
MKAVCFTLAALFAASSAQAVTVYAEDFEGQNGQGAIGSSTGAIIDTSGVDWSVDVTNANLMTSDDFVQVVDGRLNARDTSGNASWLSPIIDLTGFAGLTLSMDVSETGNHENEDFLDIEVSVDGGSTFFKYTDYLGFGSVDHTFTGNTGGEDFPDLTFVEAVTDGTEFQLRLSFLNTQSSENFFIDNIALNAEVSPVPLPASAALMALSLGALVVARRRKA